jgi:hypothetical protein
VQADEGRIRDRLAVERGRGGRGHRGHGEHVALGGERGEALAVGLERELVQLRAARVGRHREQGLVEQAHEGVQRDLGVAREARVQRDRDVRGGRDGDLPAAGPDLQGRLARLLLHLQGPGGQVLGAGGELFAVHGRVPGADAARGGKAQLEE